MRQLHFRRSFARNDVDEAAGRHPGDTMPIDPAAACRPTWLANDGTDNFCTTAPKTTSIAPSFGPLSPRVAGSPETPG